MALSTSSEVRHLADQLERSFHGGAWHGPATREALTGIDASLAGRRPDASPHTIVELVRHITFWLNATYLRIASDRDFDPEADWPEERALTGEALARTIAERERAHAKLHAALLDLEDAPLPRRRPRIAGSVGGWVRGTLQHNAYHTGQIVHIAQELTT